MSRSITLPYITHTFNLNKRVSGEKTKRARSGSRINDSTVEGMSKKNFSSNNSNCISKILQEPQLNLKLSSSSTETTTTTNIITTTTTTAITTITSTTHLNLEAIIRVDSSSSRCYMLYYISCITGFIYFEEARIN